MANYTPLLKAIEKALAKADADLEAFLEEQGYPNPSGLVEAIDSVQDVLEELLDDYLERIATALIDCADKFELMDAWNEAKEDAELKRTASDAVAEALFAYALPFLDEHIKNDDEELDASELSLKAIAEVLTLADQMTEGKIDSLNDRIEAGLQNYKEPEDSGADKAEKAAVEKGVLDDLKSKLRGLGSKIKSFGQRAIEYVFGSSKLDRARDCRGTATQTVLMYESVVQQEAIMQNPVVERKIWRHNPSDHPRENHVAMDGVMADADGFFELTGRDGTVYHIEGP
ncbi:MAG: hypothetical protein LUD84_06430 [Clostridiales bacterium]|nr:hypothetical protein [Clostridiales bacterium]